MRASLIHTTPQSFVGSQKPLGMASTIEEAVENALDHASYKQGWEVQDLTVEDVKIDGVEKTKKSVRENSHEDSCTCMNCPVIYAILHKE